MTIYRELILDHYERPHNWGRLANPDKTVTLNNPLCGDRIDLDVKVVNGIVTDIKFMGKGCAISKASASLLTDYARGKKVAELRKADKHVIISLLGTEFGPNRLKCALLPLDALHKALSIISP